MTRPGRRHDVGLTGVLAVAVLSLAAVWGCGVPADEAPRAVPADEIPEALAAAPTTTTTAEVGVAADLFFLEAEEESNVLRAEQVRLDDNLAETALRALVATVPEDLPDGVITSIPPETTVLGTQLDDGILTVDLSDEFASVSGEIRIQAVAQMVYTATRSGGPVDGVLFTVEGEPDPVPDADGADIEGPASRPDYSGLAPI